MRRWLAVLALTLSCGRGPAGSYDELCADPYGPDTDADPMRGQVELVLDPRFSDEETEEARQACEGWEAVGVRCTAYRDRDSVPDGGAVPVAKCAAKYCGGSACTYPSSRHAGHVTVGVVLHRRLLQHEVGHVLGIGGGYWHAPCDQTSILGTSLPCMAPGPTPEDGRKARAVD